MTVFWVHSAGEWQSANCFFPYFHKTCRRIDYAVGFSTTMAKPRVDAISTTSSSIA